MRERPHGLEKGNEVRRVRKNPVFEGEIHMQAFEIWLSLEMEDP